MKIRIEILSGRPIPETLILLLWVWAAPAWRKAN